MVYPGSLPYIFFIFFKQEGERFINNRSPCLHYASARTLASGALYGFLLPVVASSLSLILISLTSVRCPRVFDRCRVERPELLNAGATRAACWLHDAAAGVPLKAAA